MADIFQKQFQNEQEFKIKLQSEVKKESTAKFDKSGMEHFMQNYMNFTDQAQQTATAFDGLQVTMYDPEVFAGDIQQDVLKDRQKQMEAETDRIKKKSHSGKESNQEKAANARKTFGEFQYNTGTATNILTSYQEKKQQIAAGELDMKAELEAYKPTGRELLLAPVNNMEGGLADDVVKLMLKRDQLKDELKKKVNNASVYGESKRKMQARLLAYMEDAINTYLTANNVSLSKTGEVKSVNKKDVNAAKEHLALAMEKYEMAARNFDADIANDMMSSIEKSAAYKDKIAKGKAGLTEKSNDAENKLLSLLSKNANKVGNNGKTVKKVYADFEKINAQKLKIEQKIDVISSREIKSVSTNADENGFDDAIEVKKKEYEAQIRSLGMAAGACKAYIEYITTGKAMSMTDAIYLQKEYNITGVDVQMQDSTGKMLPLSLDEPLGYQKGVMNEYHNKAKNEMLTEMEEIKNMLAQHTEEEKKNDSDLYNYDWYLNHYNEAKKCYPRRFYESHMTLTKKYNINKGTKLNFKLRKDKEVGDRYTKQEGQPGFRDLVTVMMPLEGEETPAYEEFVEATKHVSILVSKEDPDNYPKEKGQEAPVPTTEQTLTAYEKFKPYLLKTQDELKQYVDKYPALKNLDKVGEQLDPDMYLKDFNIPLIIAKKAQGMQEILMPMLNNEILTNQISEEEKKELYEILCFVGAVNNLGNIFSQNFNKMLEATPREILEKNVMLMKGDNYEKTLENQHEKYKRFRPKA